MRLVAGTAAVLALAGAAVAQARGPIERLVVTPADAIIAPGERCTLEAWATIRGAEQNERVPCRWRLVAQQGQARLAVGQAATVAAVLEAGVAPAFVVVEAEHDDGDRVHAARATVLCSRPVLVAPARIAVGEPAPCELTLPLLPPDRAAMVSIDVTEQPAGGDVRFVGMTDGEFGPVGGAYAVKMPVQGGSVQVGLRVAQPGRYLLRGRVTVGTYELLTPPAVVLALPLASLRLAAYRPGPPRDPGDLVAGPGGHAVPGPYVIEPPQAVAPVVLGFGPGGEALGVLSGQSATFGRLVRARGEDRLQPERFPLGMLYLDAPAIAPPESGAAVRRVVRVTLLGAVARANPALRASLALCVVEPGSVVPLPVGARLRLGLAIEGRADAVTVAPLEGRSAYTLGGQASAAVAVEPQSAVDAVVHAVAPGLAQVRSRCALRDTAGGEARVRLLTEFLVVARGGAALCDAAGRPTERPDGAAWAVLGAEDAALPPGVAAAGPRRPLVRDGGTCWIVPVRTKAGE